MGVAAGALAHRAIEPDIGWHWPASMDAPLAVPKNHKILIENESFKPANIGPSIRGEKIVGGNTRHITKRDAVMIPPGVPHRFKSLDGSITYMVVRINPDYEKGK